MVVPQQVEYGMDGQKCRFPLKAVSELLCLFSRPLQGKNDIAKLGGHVRIGEIVFLHGIHGEG